MLKLSPFPCFKCGACCKIVGKMVEQSKSYEGEIDFQIQAIQEFPHKYDSTGRCEKLNDDNTCSVYNDRPSICNVDTMFEKYYSKLMTKEEYYALNVKACNYLVKIF